MAQYDQPFDCITEKGLQTPAVGKSVPVRMIIPSLTYSAAEGIVMVRFKAFVLDANRVCKSAKDFPCPTYVHVMLVKEGYQGGINSLPAPSDIYAEQDYRISIANGDNTIIFNNPSIADGAGYQLYFDFKTAPTANCSSSGTKFIFDDFSVDRSSCAGNCAPVANEDFFDGSRQSFLNTVKANVYGGFALWSSVVREGYEMKSLSNSPALMKVWIMMPITIPWNKWSSVLNQPPLLPSTIMVEAPR